MCVWLICGSEFQQSRVVNSNNQEKRFWLRSYSRNRRHVYILFF